MHERALQTTRTTLSGLILRQFRHFWTVFEPKVENVHPLRAKGIDQINPGVRLGIPTGSETLTKNC